MLFTTLLITFFTLLLSLLSTTNARALGLPTLMGRTVSLRTPQPAAPAAARAITLPLKRRSERFEIIQLRRNALAAAAARDASVPVKRVARSPSYSVDVELD